MHDPPIRNAVPPPAFGGREIAAPYERARVAVLPVPYEATVSWKPGCARGPRAVLEASVHLESFDDQIASEPRRSGIWTDPGLAVSPDLPASHVAGMVAERFGRLMDDGKWVIMLGGEHSITPGGVRAAVARHPGLHVVQLDAHADLREEYRGDRWNHACAMARCLEQAPVRALGVRSYSPEEAERLGRGIPGYRMAHAWEMDRSGAVDRVLSGLEDRPVYLSIDVDYFDPSIMPATGTPEPGGGHWWPTLLLLERLFGRARVVACDVVELAPIPGLHHAEFTVARLVYRLVGLAAGEGFSTRATPS